jgi:TIR domain
MAHDVFISHAHKDKRIAEAICEKLESARVRCWIAERDISAGEDWTEATRNAIGSSRVMVLLLSENANAAPHIEREIAHAFYTRRTIIPLRLSNTLPRRDFLFYLGNVRWFDALSPPAEQHLEALTASINGMVRGRTVTREAMPPHSATKTLTTVSFSNSWIGALRASHYRTLEILKRVAIAASLFAVGWFWWFVSSQTEHEVPPAEGHLHSMSSGRSVSLDSLPQGTQDAAASKPPTYTYTRFGLWVAPGTGPTPSVQQGVQDTSSTAPVAQQTDATPSPRPDLDQKAVGKAESLAGHDSVSAKSVQEEPTRIINRREWHRTKSRPKAHHVRGSASEGLRFADIKSRFRELWHQFVSRSKELGSR